MTVRVWPLICAWAEWRRRQRRGRRNVRMAELSAGTPDDSMKEKMLLDMIDDIICRYLYADI